MVVDVDQSTQSRRQRQRSHTARCDGMASTPRGAATLTLSSRTNVVLAWADMKDVEVTGCAWREKCRQVTGSGEIDDHVDEDVSKTSTPPGANLLGSSHQQVSGFDSRRGVWSTAHGVQRTEYSARSTAHGVQRMSNQYGDIFGYGVFSGDGGTNLREQILTAAPEPEPEPEPEPVSDDPRPEAPASLRVLWVNWTNAVPSPTDPTALPAQPASLTHTAKP